LDIFDIEIIFFNKKLLQLLKNIMKIIQFGHDRIRKVVYQTSDFTRGKPREGISYRFGIEFCFSYKKEKIEGWLIA